MEQQLGFPNSCPECGQSRHNNHYIHSYLAVRHDNHHIRSYLAVLLLSVLRIHSIEVAQFDLPDVHNFVILLFQQGNII